MTRRFRHRLNVVSEGDSWFGYPPKHPLFGEANIVDHLVRMRPRMNFLRLERSGDEALEMLSGRQRKILCRVLSELPVDILLFSGGGNDIVGKWDIEWLLKHKRPGMSAEDCVHRTRLARKIRQVRLAYQELIDIRDYYQPDTVILTHAYDNPIPRNKGAKVLGRVWSGPWLYPFMMEKGITARKDQVAIAKHLIGKLHETLTTLESARPDGSFVVIPTHGLLEPDEWRDEIHATPRGFRKIAQRFWSEMERVREAKTD